MSKFIFKLLVIFQIALTVIWGSPPVDGSKTQKENNKEDFFFLLHEL